MKKETIDKLVRVEAAVDRFLEQASNVCLFGMVAPVFGLVFWLAGNILWEMMTSR